MKENKELKKKIESYENMKTTAIIKSGKEIEEKEIKAIGAHEEVKQIYKPKRKDASVKKVFNLTPLGNVYHISFPTMYYRDVEIDIINGKLKIPETKSEYKEEIEKEVEKNEARI